MKNKHSIYDDTPIMPWVVSNSVVEEAARYLRIDIPNRVELEKYLENRAEEVYANNREWRRRINASGNKGRDTLYAFMRHWLAAELPRRMPGVRLPESFANGHEI